MQEAGQRLARNGLNEIKPAVTSWVNVLVRQFRSSFVYLLVGAAALALLLGELFDAGLIVAFILINSGLGFVQEYRSERTVAFLNKYIRRQVLVKRGGKEVSVDVRNLVVGDIVVLENGDLVPADLRLVWQRGLLVDESILTGESVSVSKITEPVHQKVISGELVPNMLFQGSAVVNGRAEGVVAATGKDTMIGQTASLVSGTVRVSTFEKNINRFSQFIFRLVVVTLGVVVLAHLLIKGPHVSLIELTLFAIALAVGVIPEALPLVTTFALSNGARVLAQKKVVVKRLSAIEDLGSIEVLCADKTGTITENVMKVVDSTAIIPNVIWWGCVGVEQGVIEGYLPNNAFDRALFQQLSKEEIDQLGGVQVRSGIPFDPTRRRTSVVVEIRFGDSDEVVKALLVKGAPEIIVERAIGLGSQARSEILSWVDAQGKLGRRCLAVGRISNFEQAEYSSERELEGLEYLGVIAFEDPLKSTAVQAIRQANALGVKVKILTGDAAVVAGAIAYQAGIIDDPKQVLSGEVFANLPIREKLLMVDKYSVFARVSPAQKHEIISLLEGQYEVGYLGEGINDAAALKVANVGLVVDSAADIAREAADIILLDQDLSVIVSGVAEGRKTFANTIKYIKVTLLSNFGNFYAVALASLVVDYLPMLPVQLLLLNLLSDFPMIAIASDQVDADELLSPRQYDVKEVVLFATLLGFVSTVFDFIMFAMFRGSGETSLQTYWFISSVITELLIMYSIRTRLPFYRSRISTKSVLLWLSIFAAGLAVALPFTHFGQSVFHFSTPQVTQLVKIVFVVGAYFLVSEVIKLTFYRYSRSAGRSKMVSS